jgi:hypothetical protein
MRTNPLKKLPGSIGYLIGGFFIMVVWLFEKLLSPFKKLRIKKKTSNKSR